MPLGRFRRHPVLDQGTHPFVCCVVEWVYMLRLWIPKRHVTYNEPVQAAFDSRELGLLEY